MKIENWDDLLVYGNKICEELKKEGFIVETTPYFDSDGVKGLCLIVYDLDGNECDNYVTGTGSLETIKNGLDNAKKWVEGLQDLNYAEYLARI